MDGNPVVHRMCMSVWHPAFILNLAGRTGTQLHQFTRKGRAARSVSSYKGGRVGEKNVKLLWSQKLAK